MSSFLRKYAILFGVLIVALILYVFTFDSKIHLGGDNAEYYQLAQGFAQFKGYVSTMLPNEPAARHFPPGYPFLLAIPMLFGITSITPLKIYTGLFFFGSILILYRLLKELKLSELATFSVIFLTITNIHLLNYSFILMSEIPYTFFSLLSIWALIKHINQPENDAKSSITNFKWLLIATIAAVISYFIRSIGIAIPIAMLIYLASNKKWKEVVITAFGSFSFIGLWQLRMSNLGGGSYSSQLMRKNPYRSELGNMETLTDWLNRIAANVERYLGKEFSSGLVNSTQFGQDVEVSFLMLLGGIIILALGLFGVYKLQKPYRLYLLLFLMGHFGILLLWPDAWFGIRFMLSLIPLMYMLIVVACAHIGSIFLSLKTGQRLGVTVLAIFAMLNLGPINQLNRFSRMRNNPRYLEYFELARAAKSQLPEDAVISCRKPAFFYMYSNRKVTGYPFTEDQDVILNDFREQGVTHVVVDNLGFSTTSRYLVPLIQDRPEHFKLLASKEGSQTYLFEFIP